MLHATHPFIPTNRNIDAGHKYVLTYRQQAEAAWLLFSVPGVWRLLPSEMLCRAVL
jgi:hypothetical protein